MNPFNITEEQAKRFAETGKFCLVVLKGKRDRTTFKGNSKINEVYEIPKHVTGTWKLLFSVGKDYAFKKKNKALWWCPDCKTFWIKATKKQLCKHIFETKPFHGVVESIEEKKLLNVTDKEAKLAGHPMKYNHPSFIGHGGDAHTSLIWIFHLQNKLKCTAEGAFQNPQVFVIKGKVKG